MSFDPSTLFTSDALSGRFSVDPLMQEARDRQRRRRRLIAALVIIAFLTGFALSRWARSGQAELACASSTACSQTSSPTTLPNPCTLLTTAQAVSAIGDKLAYRQGQVSDGVHNCTWSFMPYSNTTSAHPLVTMTINTQTRSQFARGEVKDGGQRVARVGELAYWNGPNSTITILSVWTRGFVLTFFASDSDSLKVEKGLANEAAKNL